MLRKKKIKSAINLAYRVRKKEKEKKGEREGRA